MQRLFSPPNPTTSSPTPLLAIHPELPRQLTFKTSSSKKRRISSHPLAREQTRSPSPETILPSCEADDDPAFSFSIPGPDSPSYRREDSQPASSLPQRLQTNGNPLVSADYDSSAASSPCASAYADLSLDSDKGGDEGGPLPNQPRAQSPYRVTRRVIMNGDADLPHRSSSPLKRRASSMEPEGETDVKPEGSESQGSNGLPRAMSVDPPENNGSGCTETQANRPPPPIHEQIKIIETLLKAFKEAPVEEGSKAYLVSRSWVDKALSLRSDTKRAKTDEADVKSLGPVDNQDIIEDVIKDSRGYEFIRLKAGSGLESFELFPEDAWNMVMDWYGIKERQQPIVRTAINAAPDVQSPTDIIYELHPPVFCIHRLWSEKSPIPIEQSLKATNPPPLVLVCSRKTPAHTFLKDAKTLAGIPLTHKVRVHSIPSTQNTGEDAAQSAALTPPDSPEREKASSSRDPWAHLLLDLPSFSQVRDLRIKLDLPDNTANPKYNGKSSIQIYDLVTDQTLILDEVIENFWVSNYIGQHISKSAKGVSAKGTASAPSSKTNSGRSSPAPQGPVTRARGQRKKLGRSLGSVGLQNLGNTCYMNSALQCVRSVEELTKYFLTDSYVDEINKSNPLGYNGRVALAYMGLLKEIYDEGRVSVSPRDFKTTVGRCRSTFQGWGQQDSQEFLGFLLDGLQEDLSRIKKKPYIEKPDSTDDMINDPEAIRQMAEQVWDITRRRDDSVIADLFTGMYKSTLKCPECGKISITFDPFNNLTLPLPVENMVPRTIKFFPLNDVPVKIEVELAKHSAIELLKQFVSVRTGVPVGRLMGAEEYKEKFFKIYDNQQDVSEEIGSSDVATLHELEAVPTNWPLKMPKKYRSMLDISTPPDASEWDDPSYERMVIPVVHRRPHAVGRFDGAAPPHFIILTREEASSYDSIQRKILEKVATFSTWQTLREEAEGDNTNNADSDAVVTTASDADSSGDGKVASHSVQGEEDMVDVTMQDASERTATQANGSDLQQTVLKQFNSKRPAFLQPGSFLDPELQNMFELSYFVDRSDGPVPTGWSQVDNTRMLPKLSDRMPQTSTEDDHESPGSCGSAVSGNEESANEDNTTTETVQTRMAEESSDEDDQGHRFARRPPPQRGGFKGKKKFKDRKTYGKKGNKRREKIRAQREQQRAAAVKPQPMPPAEADGGPLVRLGEGLAVDWNEEAWETVFGRSSTDDSNGARTFLDLETLPDKALKMSQKRRQARRSRGITLEECLDEFERAEVLSEQDMWYCPRCKEHRRASKKFDLWKSPDILVAHLKRFSSSGYRRDKLDILVDFPIEGLDLTSRVIQKEDAQDEIYDLIAVDDHYGGLGGGHYTAYAKNFMDGRWYNYNDSSVHQVSDPSTLITSAAYLLFYRRRSKEPLGGPRFAEIFEKFDNPNDDDDDESATEVGDDQGSDESFAKAPVRSRNAATTTIRSLADSDDEDVPPYSSSATVHRSVEDEGIEMVDHYQRLGSNPVSQAWSFNTNGNTADGSDCASDAAQVSSDDERGDGEGSLDQDIEMSSVAAAHSDTEGPSPPKGSQDPRLISVPAKTGSDRDSEEVAEIHIEGDNRMRAE